MPWLITKITDCGRGKLYRWHVEGQNTEGVRPVDFAWAVQSVADYRYQPAPEVDDATLRAILVAKVICSPPPGHRWADLSAAEILAALRGLDVDDHAAPAPSRPCLACAREEQAAAGFPGIDRLQAGHSCGTPGYALDGEVVDLEDFLATNEEGLSVEQVAEIKHMMPGDSLLLGGGAGETFTLTRTR